MIMKNEFVISFYLTFQNSDFSHKIYDIWLSIPKSEKSNAMIMTMRSQKELKLKAGFFEVTLEQYVYVKNT